MKKGSGSENFQIILLYTIANFMIFFNDGIYIDDWALLHNPEGVRIDSINNSRPLAGLLFSFTNLFSNPALVFRSITFFSFLLSAFVFREILRRLKFIDPSEHQLFTLLYALMPLCFDSRIEGALLLYYFCYFAFITGLWLLILSIERRNVLLRLLALPLFFFSFTTKSLVFFHVVTPLAILYFYQWPKGLKDKFITLMKYPEVFLIPVLFWYTHKVYFPVSQANQGYNEISAWNIAITPYSILIAFQGSFIGLFEQVFESLTKSTFVLVFFGLFSFWIFKKVKATDAGASTDETRIWGLRKPVFYLVLGGLLFITGTIPYAFVGKLPNFVSANTRLQILYQFSFCLIIVGIVNLAFTPKLRKYVYTLLLGGFMGTGIYFYSYYQLWWFKSLSMIENLKSNEVIRDHTTFIVKDNVLKNSPTIRMYDPYEYNGMMKYAYGTQTRYSVNEDKVLDSTTFYNGRTEPEGTSVRDYVRKDFEYRIHINTGSYRVGFGNCNMDMLRCFSLMTTRILSPEKFREKIKNIVVLRTEPIQQGIFEQR